MPLFVCAAWLCAGGKGRCAQACSHIPSRFLQEQAAVQGGVRGDAPQEERALRQQLLDQLEGQLSKLRGVQVCVCVFGREGTLYRHGGVCVCVRVCVCV